MPLVPHQGTRVFSSAAPWQHVLGSDTEWRERANAVLRMEAGTVSAVLLDPFSRRQLNVDLPTSTKVDKYGPKTLVQRLADAQAVADLIQARQGADAVASVPLLEDLETGEYVTCLCAAFAGEVRREPVFVLSGKVIVGRAVVVRGYEVASPLGHTVDHHVDHPGVEEGAVGWLDVKEAKRARAAYRAGQIELYDTLLQQSPQPETVIVGCKVPLPTERGATCWACGRATNSETERRHVCGRCKTAHYCDRACQAAHWDEHRAACVYTGDASRIEP